MLGCCLNAAKARVWSEAGIAPEGVAALAPGSCVWVGDQALPPSQQGLVALGVPIGAPAFVETHLQSVLARQTELLRLLPLVGDTQVAWLLLSYCAAPRAQYPLRTLPPLSTRAYAAVHDAAVLSCLDALLFADAAAGLPPTAALRAQLALRHGGLGLRSAVRHAPAAFWASWADSIKAIALRSRSFAQALTDSLRTDAALPPVLSSLREAHASLLALGFDPLPGHLCWMPLCLLSRRRTPISISLVVGSAPRRNLSMASYAGRRSASLMGRLSPSWTRSRGRLPPAS